MMLFIKRKYIVVISIGLNSSPTRPVKYVLHVDIDLSWLFGDIVGLDWMRSVLLCKKPRLRTATNENDEATDIPMFHVPSLEARERV